MFTRLFIKHRWLAPLADFLLLLGVVWCVQLYLVRNVDDNIRIPPLTGSTLNTPGGEVPYSLLGAPKLVYFWSIGCVECNSMHKGVSALAESYQVIGVAYQSGDAKEVERYLRNTELNFPVVLDENGDFGRAYGVKQAPALFVLDKNGVLRYAEHDSTTNPGLRLRLMLAGWLY